RTASVPRSDSGSRRSTGSFRNPCDRGAHTESFLPYPLLGPALRPRLDGVANRYTVERTRTRLLHRDRRALLLELLLHILRFSLRDLLLHRLRSAIHQILGFLQAEPGQLADHLDDLDLLLAGRAEDDVELCLLLDGGRPGPAHRRPRAAAPPPPPTGRTRDGRDRHRRRGRHAPLLLQELRELRRFQQRQLVELLGDLLYRCHRCLLY